MTEGLPLNENLQVTLKKWQNILTSRISNFEKRIVALENMQLSDWLPVTHANGAMTAVITQVFEARYKRFGKFVFITGEIEFTTGGVANTDVYMTLPLGIKNSNCTILCRANTGGSSDFTSDVIPAQGVPPIRIQMRRPGAANWGLAAGQRVKFMGFYPIADGI